MPITLRVGQARQAALFTGCCLQSADVRLGGLHLRHICAHCLVSAKECSRKSGHVKSPSRVNAAWPHPGTPAGILGRALGPSTAWPVSEEAELPGWVTRQDLSSPRPGEPQEPCVLRPATGSGAGVLYGVHFLIYLGGPAGAVTRAVWRCLHRTIEDCPLKHQSPCSQPNKGRREEARVRADENHPATLLRAQMGITP